MPPVFVAEGIEIPADEIALEFSRAGGPGGQNVNKVESRVTLRFGFTRSPSIPEPHKSRMAEQLATRLTKNGELLVSAQKHRDRGQNVLDAFERLSAMLRAAYAIKKPRRPTKRSRGANERRLKEKRVTGERKSGRKDPGGD